MCELTAKQTLTDEKVEQMLLIIKKIKIKVVKLASTKSESPYARHAPRKNHSLVLVCLN